MPLLAVITAFLAGIPLITITVSDNALQPDIAEGLRVSSTAYVALVESITGLTINGVAGVADFSEMRAYAEAHEITTRRSLSRQARPLRARAGSRHGGDARLRRVFLPVMTSAKRRRPPSPNGFRRLLILARSKYAS